MVHVVHYQVEVSGGQATVQTRSLLVLRVCPRPDPFSIIPAVERKVPVIRARSEAIIPAGGTFLIRELRIVNRAYMPSALSITIVSKDSCHRLNGKMRLTLNRFNIGFPCAIAFFRRLKMSFTWSLF